MILFLFWGDREFEALLLGQGVSVTGEPRWPPRLLVGALASSSDHAAQDLDWEGLRRQKDAVAEGNFQPRLSLGKGGSPKSDPSVIVVVVETETGAARLAGLPADR